MQLTLTPQPNGDLRATFDEEDRAELTAMLTERTDLDILLEGTEHYWTNGSYQPFDASAGNPFVGLTSAPCIAQAMDYADDGTAMIEGAFWYHTDYMIHNAIETMLEQGHVDFTRA